MALLCGRCGAVRCGAPSHRRSNSRPAAGGRQTSAPMAATTTAPCAGARTAPTHAAGRSCGAHAATRGTITAAASGARFTATAAAAASAVCPSMNADMGGGGSVGRFSAGCWRQGRSRRVAAAVGPAAATGLGATAVQQLQQQQQGAQQVVTVYDLSDEVVDYEQAWAWQKLLLERAVSAAEGGTRGSAHALLLLQHPPTYTLGSGSTTDNLRFNPESSPIPLYRTERGGEVTYHGPGQLVLYPILDLQALNPDLHWYLRQLEQVVIEALDAVSGLEGERVEGLTGVWVGGAKVAAIGVRAKRWISYHGVAVNVVADLSPFKGIVPCGIADRPVTSVQRLVQERQRAEDPFAPATTAPGQQQQQQQQVPGLGDMVPLAEATQEDLRRMLAAAGASPLMLQETSPASAPGQGEGAEFDMDDPFAPPPSASAPQQPTGLSTPPGESFLHAAADGTGQAAALEAREAARSGDGGFGGVKGMGATGVKCVWDEEEQLLLREYSCALLEAFGEVFGVGLRAGDVGELPGRGAGR